MDIEEIKTIKLNNIYKELTEVNKQIVGLETQRYNLNVRLDTIERVSTNIIKKHLFKTILYLVSSIEGRDYLLKLIDLTDSTTSYLVCDNLIYDDASLDSDGITSFILACDEGEDTLYISKDNLACINTHFNYVIQFIEQVLAHQINKEYYLFEMEMKEIANTIIEEYKGKSRIYEK